MTSDNVDGVFSLCQCMKICYRLAHKSYTITDSQINPYGFTSGICIPSCQDNTPFFSIGSGQLTALSD